ncbi:hypothetical protein [Actinomadura sp. BRA 177]|uniref:hypothetical protein n=1 Tax=Actinomadura sp. BRA 177 TaxID=2745202 RepID=UPI0015956906|nr:hypothetical protein [Actinomadura sp. BRA 177]NVI88238.1 hypothetical protein [Actinomadura sp. BRA 177]
MNAYEREILGPGRLQLADAAEQVAEGSAALRQALTTVTATVAASDGTHLPATPVDMRTAGRRLAASAAVAAEALAALETDLAALAQAARAAGGAP